MKKNNSRGIPHKHIHSRILVQLVIFALVFLAIIGFITYDVIAKHLVAGWVVGGAALGVLIGLAAGRMFILKWHEDTQKVILSMDKLSFLLIGAYIVFRVFSEQLLGGILHGEELSVATFGLLAGIMLGRLLSMLTNIRKVLKKQGII
jgi:hypothetical protein